MFLKILFFKVSAIHRSEHDIRTLTLCAANYLRRLQNHSP